MNIRLLTDNDRDNWQRWVFANPKTTFYHRIEWKDVIEKSFKHDTYYLLATKQDTIHGILPLVHIKSHLFGNILCSMPFLNFGGVCADSGEAYQGLLDSANDLLQAKKADYVELRHIHPSPNGLRRKEHKVSMTVALDPDPEVLWKNFKTKHRTNIRRAEKNGLEIVRGGREYLKIFYQIISTGWRDLGTPIYRIDFFENIISALGDSVEIYLVYHHGRPIATAFNGLFRDTVEGMWIYSLREHAALQTNYLLYWTMIRDACLRGLKLYHLGRSTSASGATFFKRKWNAYTQQLYWEYLLNNSRCRELPELNVDNPKYKMAIGLWRRLPVKLTNRIGPFISKSLP
jgi:FemAB-related protein (PEP-CTERM system-associated)